MGSSNEADQGNKIYSGNDLGCSAPSQPIPSVLSSCSCFVLLAKYIVKNDREIEILFRRLRPAVVNEATSTAPHEIACVSAAPAATGWSFSNKPGRQRILFAPESEMSVETVKRICLEKAKALRKGQPATRSTAGNRLSGMRQPAVETWRVLLIAGYRDAQ